MQARITRAAGLILVVMIAAILAVIPAYAAGPMQQSSDFHTLAAGQTAEWDLTYTGGGNQAMVELAMDPANSVAFKVFTDNQWNAMMNASLGSTVTPIGQGTQRTVKNSDGTYTVQNNGDLFWVTADPSSGTYHIQVTNTTQQTARYMIMASGAGNGGFTQFGVSVQMAQNTTGTNGQMAQSTTGTNGQMAQSTTGTNGQTAQSTTGTSATAQAPRTLPVTGGSELELFCAAGLALVATGWLTRRRTS